MTRTCVHTSGPPDGLVLTTPDRGSDVSARELRCPDVDRFTSGRAPRCALAVSTPPWQPQDKGYFGLEFSPDGTNLYVSEFRYAVDIPYIWQFELDTHDATAINSSRTPIGGRWQHNGNCSLTLGPDDRIHVGVAGITGMHVIRFPNEEGAACGFQGNWLSSAFHTIGMNNHVVENRAAREVQASGPTQVCNGTTGVSYTVQHAHPAKNQWIYNGPNTVVSNTAGELVMDFTTGGVDTLIAVKLNDCYGDRYDTLFIHVDLQLPLLPPDTTLCDGSTLEISPGTGYANVQWQDGSTTPTLTANGPGTYSVTVTSLGGCSLSDAMQVTALPNTLSVDLGNDTSYCYNHGITLQVPQGLAPPYLWSTGATAASITHGSLPTSIWLQVTDANGCLARDTINLTPWSNYPAFTLGPDVELCPGEVVVLSPTLYAGVDPVFTWSNGTAGPTLIVWETGTHWLTAAFDYSNEKTNYDIRTALKEYLEEHRAENMLDTNLVGVADNLINGVPINIYIDDLDRGWKGSLNDIRRLSALLNAIRDLVDMLRHC